MTQRRRFRRGRRRHAGLLLLGVMLLAAALPSALAARSIVAGPPTAVVYGLLPPVAVNDSTTAVHGQLRTVAAPGVLSNDLQIGGGYTAVLVTNVANGTLTLDANGGYRYRSDATFVGTDTFRYKVDGGLLGISNTATVTITVTNIAPVARSDAYTATAGVERSVAAPGLLADDTDADGDTLTASLVSGPANGTVSVSANGSFRYTADVGFSGVDTFRYRATDGIAWSGTVNVDMTVAAPTPAPTAAPTPTPTPAPTPTPGPTATGGGTPTPDPTSTSGGTPAPTGSAAPGGSAMPSGMPAAGPSTDPGASGAPSAEPGAYGSPDPSGSPDATGSAGTGGTGGAGTGTTDPDGSGSGSGSGSTPGGSVGPFEVGTRVRGGPIAVDLDASFSAFGGFEWAIPAAALSVPLLLVILAIVGQGLVGLAWVPLTRRWLGGDRRRRPRPYVAIA